MKEIPKPKNTVRFQIRIPADLHVELLSASVRNDRTLNGEIVARLGVDPFAAALAEHTSQVREVRELSVKILNAVTK